MRSNSSEMHSRYNDSLYYEYRVTANDVKAPISSPFKSMANKISYYEYEIMKNSLLRMGNQSPFSYLTYT
ncbi:hypothetical protein BpHYR1_013882 [Brachionus plicatilis]|uniref:Uncharacterized protein n=1 Tax=Brachionus plicatilis TaxID=10195 RepID=A0A3M7PNM0_BRAPC|nr:hypothetical protein BpHYR1_013882 [Brachionus plicatilis]